MQPDRGGDAAAGPAPDSAIIDEDARSPAPLQVWEEELSFVREPVETGRVRVRRVTTEHDQTVELPLSRETVEVERVPIGREIETAPAIRQEGDVTIIPVVEEAIVVQRKLVLKEELRLRLVRTTEQHRETVTLRRHDAVIERLPAAHPSSGPKAV